MNDDNYYTWEYQESMGLYHIFPSNETGDEMIGHGSIYLEVPRKNANDELVKEIVSSLKCLAEYNYYETGFQRTSLTSDLD